jgi:hypothetical protein
VWGGVMLRRLRAWLRRINEARQARRDASFEGQLARAVRCVDIG